MTEQLSRIVGRQIGYLWPVEIDELKVFANTMLPLNPLIVVIGGGSGTFDLAIAEERQDVKITSVDILNCTGERGNMDAAGYGNLLTQVIGDSKDVGKTFKQKIDFLFVDGDHSYEGVLADIDAWLPHVKKGGYIGFHDYSTQFWQPVVNAVDLRMAKYKKVLQAGTTVIFRK